MTRKICLLVDCPDSESDSDLIHKLHQAILAGNPSMIEGDNPDEIAVTGAFRINTPLTRMEVTFADQFLNKEEAANLDRMIKRE